MRPTRHYFFFPTNRTPFEVVDLEPVNPIVWVIVPHRSAR